MVVYFSLARFDEALKKAAEEDLEHLVRNIYALCKAKHEMMPDTNVPFLVKSGKAPNLKGNDPSD